jgi:hypothetical protein
MSRSTDKRPVFSAAVVLRTPFTKKLVESAARSGEGSGSELMAWAIEMLSRPFESHVGPSDGGNASAWLRRGLQAASVASEQTSCGGQ